ncbi:hypothetical protein DL93DRAFT_145099 [Clavulina sp. PMI_390]|nr:hypothetical protein DL93DRAFT_145099 [Clavulina sp. PMI_390]
MSNHSDNNSGLQRLKSNSTTSQDGFGLTGEELKKQISNLLEVIESPTVDAKTLSLSVMQIRSFAKRPTTSFQYSRNTITMDNSSLDKLEISGTPVSIYSGKRDNLTIARHTWNDVNEETFGIIKQHMLSLLFEIRHSHILTVDSAICLYSKTSYPPRQVHVLAADDPRHSPQSYILSTPVLGRPLVWTNIARSIALALHYLHSAPLCLPHGDIQAVGFSFCSFGPPHSLKPILY